tara:strand:- start:3421 stop:3597 length:177 start_codon:yes stop_codon:yes gene_type:complete
MGVEIRELKPKILLWKIMLLKLSHRRGVREFNITSFLPCLPWVGFLYSLRVENENNKQ